ncbi:PREDICTED: protein downstream neighbor of Son-like isoform X2 [Lupinus angustifolius]|uniref:protein downstream neighbor of Son-like isoform X2 n=1 Tax=Lupinus angustifolius TaxID=3871 RepID=UPI00092E225A|nr:PREDICTED: protein downstream neighbor of Son-like isoform X2 [Lupinus angustifolius]
MKNRVSFLFRFCDILAETHTPPRTIEFELNLSGCGDVLMAKVATPNSVHHSSGRIGLGPPKGGSGSGGSMVNLKRKTPSELRGEQLKRASAVGHTESVVDHTDESPPPLDGFSSNKTTKVDNGFKKPGLSRTSRYTDTRVDELFPAKKSRFKTVSGKENAKENEFLEKTSILKNLSVFANSETTRQQGISRLKNSVASTEVSIDGVLQACQTTEKCSQGKFLSVSELSSAADRSSGLAAPVDMGKTLRGLFALDPNVGNGLAAESSEKRGDLTSAFTGIFFSECHVPGQKAPLDLTLKTSMRVVCSSSVNWIHRSVLCGAIPFEIQNTRVSQGSKILHSWIYPQSVLPPSLISVLSSSTADGELEFLRKRQVDWEESFRNLYYMLRKNICGLFYICTSQFVVMFTGGDSSKRSNCSCNAYISKSTRGLRSLLREHDVCFSMPLCHSKVEQVTTEDLAELSEIEKQNLGQTRRLWSFSDVDNSPESLLVFIGNDQVHGLYDVLLNYRSILTSLSGMDVPVLYSPVPFQNSSLSSPNIKCMEMRRAEHIAASFNGSILKDSESAQRSSDDLCCSIEIKDAFLPPWIISGICALMGSEGRSFEASFVTEPSSLGLNVALKSACEKSESKATGSENMQNCSDTFGISEAVVTSSLQSCSLKGLKYYDGSYTATLSPVTYFHPEY